jgi:hypothetical protein
LTLGETQRWQSALVDPTWKLEQPPANSLTPLLPKVCATTTQIDLWLVYALILKWQESWRVNKGGAAGQGSHSLTRRCGSAFLAFPL